MGASSVYSRDCTSSRDCCVVGNAGQGLHAAAKDSGGERDRSALILTACKASVIPLGGGCNIAGLHSFSAWGKPSRPTPSPRLFAALTSYFKESRSAVPVSTLEICVLLPRGLPRCRAAISNANSDCRVSQSSLRHYLCQGEARV